MKKSSDDIFYNMGTFSTSVRDTNKELSSEEMGDIISRLSDEIPSRDVLRAIVITKIAPKNGFFKRQSEFGFYLLCSKEYWQSISGNFVKEDSENGLNFLTQVPVLEDDAIALDIFEFGKILTEEEKTLIRIEK